MRGGPRGDAPRGQTTLRPKHLLLSALLVAAAAAQDSSLGPAPGPRPPLPPPPASATAPTPAPNEPWIGDDGRPAAWRPATTAVAAIAETAKPLPELYAGIDCSTRPSQLLAGGSGTLYVLLQPHGPAVLAAAANLQLQVDAGRTPLRIGAANVPPPPSGSLCPGFGDRPVHRDTVVAALPVAVAAGTAPGEYPVRIRCTVELHDADAGVSLGCFVRELEVAVAVRGADAAAAPPPTGSRVLPAAAPPVPAMTLAPAAPLQAPAEGDPLPLLLAGGAVLLLLAVLLLRRR